MQAERTTWQQYQDALRDASGTHDCGRLDYCDTCMNIYGLVRKLVREGCRECTECGRLFPPTLDGDLCAECDAPRCECCDSASEHDAAMERSRREFLADPGEPPAHFTPEQVERAERGMARDRGAK